MMGGFLFFNKSWWVIVRCMHLWLMLPTLCKNYLRWDSMVATFSINDFTKLKVFALICFGEPNLFAKKINVSKAT